MQNLLLDAAVLDRRKIVRRRPEARGVFLVIVDRPGFERLEGDLPLAIILETQAVEIVLAQIDRQLRPPIVRITGVFDEPTLLERLDSVRAGAKRRIERRCSKIAAAPPGRRE